MRTFVTKKGLVILINVVLIYYIVLRINHLHIKTPKDPQKTLEITPKITRYPQKTLEITKKSIEDPPNTQVNAERIIQDTKKTSVIAEKIIKDPKKTTKDTSKPPVQLEHSSNFSESQIDKKNKTLDNPIYNRTSDNPVSPRTSEIIQHGQQKTEIIQETKKKGVQNRHQVVTSVPSPAYMCVRISSGFGNQMYIFASAYGLAQAKNMKLVAENLDNLKSAFFLNGDYESNKTLCDGTKFVREYAACKLSPNLVNLPGNKSVTICGYLQSFKYFEHVRKDIQRFFTFRTYIMKAAKLKLTNLLSGKYAKETNNITLVGIHIRRGDYGNKQKMKYGYKMATKEYMHKAQDYMRQNYERVTFVVCTNGLDWARETFQNQSDVIIAPMDSGPIDMALLTLMDHMIITVGTYGFWAAWLNPKNGTVIYYKDLFVPNSDYSKEFAHPNTDTYYPYWIGM